MNVASFFAGCGGLDLGFEQAGFDVVWANENDLTIHKTYKINHPKTILCEKDIQSIMVNDIPDCDGFIGGPPCQSWSVGGKQLGLKDARGRLFIDYIYLIRAKHPKFFVIENVKGIISDKHLPTFLSFLSLLTDAGYIVSYSLLNAADYRIPQDRQRVFVVGISKEINCVFDFPSPFNKQKVTLKQAIGDIDMTPHKYLNEKVHQSSGELLNHDIYVGSFDAKFMARNRVRQWEEISFTIQAQAKNAPLHPQAPKMLYISPKKRIFVPGKEYLYRRLSVRECARIQSFPDSFKFIYSNIKDGYNMVGNSVPPRLAKIIALKIKETLTNVEKDEWMLVGYYKSQEHLDKILQNQLYYVRTGFKYGALTYPVGKISPKYLLLHNRNNRFLFNLIEEIPLVKSASYLREMGFSPSGGEYLTFKIKSKVEDENILNTEIQGVAFNKAIPYLCKHKSNK